MKLSTIPSLAYRLMVLFSPLQGYRGVYPKELMANPSKDGKLEAAGRFDGIFEIWGEKNWQAHLDGEERFGSAPLRHDGTIRFAAIDIDEYIVTDHEIFARKLRKIHENFILCRSKSGGKHLYVFFSEDVSAKNVRDKLYEVLSVMGLAKKEIFPANDTLLSGIKHTGNYINTPYFNNKDTLQYAFHPDTAQAMSLAEFLTYAESHKFTEKEFVGLKLINSSLFKDGPPCLQILFENGVTEGMRQTILMNAGVYAKLAHLSEWQKKLAGYNSLFKPPLPDGELKSIENQLRHNDYRYQCQKEPLCSHCDRKKCQMRKYGVNNNSSFPFIESIVKYDTEPPTWFLFLDGGQKISCSTEELQNSKRFQKCAMEQANIVTPIIKDTEWSKYLHELMPKLQVIEVPKEVKFSGLLIGEIENFLRNRSSGKTKDDLLQDMVVREDGTFYFCLRILLNYLRSQQFKVTPAQVTLTLRDMGAENVMKHIGRTTRRVVELKESAINIEAEEIPEVPLQKLGVV